MQYIEKAAIFVCFCWLVRVLMLVDAPMCISSSQFCYTYESTSIYTMMMVYTLPIAFAVAVVATNENLTSCCQLESTKQLVHFGQRTNGSLASPSPSPSPSHRKSTDNICYVCTYVSYTNIYAHIFSKFSCVSLISVAFYINYSMRTRCRTPGPPDPGFCLFNRYMCINTCAKIHVQNVYACLSQQLEWDMVFHFIPRSIPLHGFPPCERCGGAG